MNFERLILKNSFIFKHYKTNQVNMRAVQIKSQLFINRILTPTILPTPVI